MKTFCREIGAGLVALFLVMGTGTIFGADVPPTPPQKAAPAQAKPTTTVPGPAVLEISVKLGCRTEGAKDEFGYTTKRVVIVKNTLSKTLAAGEKFRFRLPFHPLVKWNNRILATPLPPGAEIMVYKSDMKKVMPFCEALLGHAK